MTEREPKPSLQQLAEDYLISLKMVKTLDPESELYKWHEERRDYIKGIFEGLTSEREKGDNSVGS